MGKPPAAIIIARHGARLDAADKNWHLTSPTPYDPPLSYGGWLQSRALGARIVSLLNSQDEDSPLNTTSGSPRSYTSSANVTPDSSARSSPQPQFSSKRKRRVIIHTSPYLRCLQTAIAVSSGISQYHPFPDSDATGAPTGPDDNPNRTAPSPDSHRSLLRVDAFLGEWLSPDYFEDITPPPNSERLIGAAKAELLRRSVNTVPQADVSNKPPTGYFPGGWGSSSTPGSPIREDRPPGPSRANSTAGRGQRSRAGSYDTLNSAPDSRPKGLLSRINTNLSSIPDDSPGSYVPPTPSYAIAPFDPIPAGYVTHARNACARVDYQWDSMRAPQSWGDGGNYGEEWNAMHTRFRNGLESMVEWYQDHGSKGLKHQTLDGCEKNNDKDEDDDDDDDAVDTVLVLITHGAGCNAMVGALTGEPVLLDFNTASLTMAVRKGAFEDDSGVKFRYRSASDPSSLRAYDLKLAASVDHLRPSTKHLSRGGSSNLSPTTLTSPPIPSYRHRAPSRSSLTQGQFIIGPSTPGLSSQSWMNGRPSTAPRGGSGLWGSSSTGGEDSADEIVPNFGGPALSHSSTHGEGGAEPKSVEASASWGSNQIHQRTLSQRGLWGDAPLNTDRTDVKRRWTVTERRV